MKTETPILAPRMTILELWHMDGSRSVYYTDERHNTVFSFPETPQPAAQIITPVPGLACLCNRHPRLPSWALAALFSFLAQLLEPLNSAETRTISFFHLCM